MKLFKYPHPLSSGHITIMFHPCTLVGGVLFAARFDSKKLTERAKADGAMIWTVRFLCFTIGYGRML